MNEIMARCFIYQFCFDHVDAKKSLITNCETFTALHQRNLLKY